MLIFLLLILCLNIDALSYGIAYGLKKQKLNIMFIFVMSLISTILFAIPLFISKYIYNYFNETICKILNGIILIILGIKYLLPQKDKNNLKKQTKKYSKLFEHFMECLAFSADAFFTALLSGFSENFYLFSVFFYGITNFLAIICGNYIFYFLNKNIKINLNVFSGIIFITLGIFKIIGF